MVHGILAFRTNTAGQIVLQIGNASYDGYQTEEGFYVTRPWTDTTTGSQYTTAFRGAPHVVALSNPIGLYHATIRTQWTSSNGERGGFTDWSGNGAVVTTADSVWIDLELSNASGGSVGLYGASSLDSKRGFDLWSQHRTVHLKGFVSAGNLIGEWIDVRDGGRFEGVLNASRQ